MEKKTKNQNLKNIKSESFEDNNLKNLKVKETEFEYDSYYEKIYNQKLLAEITLKSVKETLEPKTKFKFSCTACGNCCKGGGSVYFTENELEKIYDHLSLSGEAKNNFHNKLINRTSNGYYVHENDKACYFLDKNNKCSIYNLRPLQCSTYPFWPSVFRNQKEFEVNMKDCPGLKKGKFLDEGNNFELAEVVKRLTETQKDFLEKQIDESKYFMI